MGSKLLTLYDKDKEVEIPFIYVKGRSYQEPLPDTTVVFIILEEGLLIAWQKKMSAMQKTDRISC